MSTKQRVANFRIDSAERTDQGALKVKANLTKTGVFEYKLPTGEVIREFRSPEEVFSQAAMDSLHGSPVTLLHPAEFVTTGNWDLLAVGNVIGVSADDPYVCGTLLIHDSRVIQKIEEGDLKEISCGYSADIVPAPEGETRFDAVQKGLNYNHAAIGPAQWGRLGTDVALRLDSNNQQILDAYMTSKKTDEAPAEELETQEKPAEELAPEPAAKEDSEQESGLVEATVADYGPIIEKLDTILARLDSLDKEVVAEEEAEAAEEPEEKTDSVDIDALVEERVQQTLRVRQAHAVLCPEERQDGKSDSELCVEGLKAVDVDPEGHDDKALIGMLETAAKTSTKIQDAAPKTSFAERLLGAKIPAAPAELSFAERLAESALSNQAQGHNSNTGK